MSWAPSWLRPIPPPDAPGADRIHLVEATDSAQTASSSPPPSTSSPARPSSSIPSQSARIAGDVRREVEEAEEDSGPILAIPMTGFALGFGAGLYGGAKRSSLVFMAENAHRRPDTVQGWFFYNKTKVGFPSACIFVGETHIVHDADDVANAILILSRTTAFSWLASPAA
jgi:hypothetical protein